MGDRNGRPGRMALSFVLSAIACLVSGAALAQVSTTSPVPLSYFLVQQPVDVCTDAGTGCGFLNNSLQTVLSAPYACTANGVNTQCANLFAGYVDPVTGMLAERNIYAAYYVDVRQTPVVQYNCTACQTIQVDSCTMGSTGCSSQSLNNLIQQNVASGNAIAKGATPTFPRNQSALTMNHFHVKNICSAAKQGCTTGNIVGIGAQNGNGFATANLMYLPQSSGCPDCDGHEKGHNLAMDHTTLGAGAANILMSAANARTVPTPLPLTGSKMDGWVTQIFPNAASPLDQLTTAGVTPGYCSSLATCDNEAGAVLLSGFLNPTPITTTLACPPGGCNEDAAVQAAAKSNSSSSGTEFQIFTPNDGNCGVSTLCGNASLVEVDVVLTQGKFDNSSGHSFQVFQPCANASPCSTSPVLAAPPIISHGNNGNEACQSLGPTTWCLTLKFAPGAFMNNDGFLDFTIGTKPADATQLAGTACYFWESASGVPYYSSCADLSYNGFGLFSNSQMVNLAINPLIPLNFTGTPGNLPCTGSSCPDPTTKVLDQEEWPPT